MSSHRTVFSGCPLLALQSDLSPPPIQGLNNAVALDFDYREQMIYWTDVTTQGSMIRRMHLNGSSVQVRPGGWLPAHKHWLRRPSPSGPAPRALSVSRPTPLLPTHLPPSLLSHCMTLLGLALPLLSAQRKV